MYTEVHPVQFQGGIHNGTLDALRHFGPHGLRLNGLDPSDWNNWEAIMQQGRPESQVEIGVENPDPQAARDIATIARHTIWNGRNLWPGRVIPPERFNQGANYLRQHEGLPAEPMQAVASASVTGEMSVTSKWQVVALGELQQPGGVGATQDYNPVVDGPNPNGPDFTDNATNSPEQEVALETWVNTAIDLLNRGEDPQAIIAQLAHDGCPDPQGVLERAQQQPDQAPVSDEIGQNAFEAPAPDDPSQNGQMESLSQQPPVMAKRVRIAGTTMTGVELERWEGLWGEGQVKIALDGGGTMNVDPSAVEEFEGDAPKHPVSEIESFINSLPEVQPSRPYIEARIANLELARRAVRSTISKVSFSDQVKLTTIDSNAEAEISELKDFLGGFTEGYEFHYEASQPRFSFNAFEVATPEIQAWGGRVKEAAQIWVAESPFYKGSSSVSDFQQAALYYASNLGMTRDEAVEFLNEAHEAAKSLPERAAMPTAEPVDNDGPAEALYL